MSLFSWAIGLISSCLRALYQHSLSLYLFRGVSSTTQHQVLLGIVDILSKPGLAVVFNWKARNIDLGLLALRFPESGRFGSKWASVEGRM
jgi:hypothetical protein